MRKNIFIAILAIVGILIVVNLIRDNGGRKEKNNMWVNNKISASFSSNTINEPIGEIPSTAEIYIDASGSMKPYFKADGTSMINTLSEIKNLNQSGTSIYFLDNKKPYKGLVRDIITDINKQPNNSNTLFHDFFDKAACKLDTTNTIIYLVTDGIMSIHDTSRDMSTALLELGGKITNSLSRHQNIAGAIFRYTGEFKGTYWNSKSKPVVLKEQINRPYYIIALGHKEFIRKLQTISKDKLNNPEELYMGLHDLGGHKGATSVYGDNGVIENLNSPVTLILDLPNCLHNVDETNAILTNDNNKLNIPVEKKDNRLVAVIPPTTPLRPDSDGRIKINLSIKNQIPTKWVLDWNCDNDINGPDAITTYGLETLVKGMFNGLENDTILLSVDFIYKRQ